MTAIPDPPGGGLGPQARALLDAAREGLSPDPAAVRRVHARIHVATGGAAAGAALGVKLGLVALVAVGVAAGAAAYRRGPVAVAPPAIELANPTEQPQQAAVHEAVLPAPVPALAAGAVDDALIVLEPAPRAVRRAAPRPDPQARPPAAGAGIALGREVELIDQAMAALRGGDPGEALRVVHDYAREAAGGGQLAEDAAAIEVEALCTLGDPAARDRRARFDARFPRSAQQARLAAACR